MKNLRGDFNLLLSFVIVALLIVGGGIYIYKNKKSDTISAIKVCKIKGVSVSLSSWPNYSCDTIEHDGVFALVNIMYWDKPLPDSTPNYPFSLGIATYSSQEVYDNSLKSIVFEDTRFNFNLLNSSYQIGGTTGLYYEDKSDSSRTWSGQRKIIGVPSKLAIVTIDDLTDFNPVNHGAVNTPKISVDSILNSISFDSESQKQQKSGLTKICSTNEISLSLPNRPNYICNTLESNVVSRITIEYWDGPTDDSGGNLTLLVAEKFTSQKDFARMTNEHFNLVNSNYPIGGTTGLYYEGKPEIFRSNGKDHKKLVIPSELMFVYVSALSDPIGYGVDNSLRETLKTEVNSILDSLSF